MMIKWFFFLINQLLSIMNYLIIEKKICLSICLFWYLFFFYFICLWWWINSITRTCHLLFITIWSICIFYRCNNFEIKTIWKHTMLFKSWWSCIYSSIIPSQFWDKQGVKLPLLIKIFLIFKNMLICYILVIFL